MVCFKNVVKFLKSTWFTISVRHQHLGIEKRCRQNWAPWAEAAEYSPFFSNFQDISSSTSSRRVICSSLIHMLTNSIIWVIVRLVDVLIWPTQVRSRSASRTTHLFRIDATKMRGGGRYPSAFSLAAMGPPRTAFWPHYRLKWQWKRRKGPCPHCWMGSRGPPTAWWDPSIPTKAIADGEASQIYPNGGYRAHQGE